MNDAPFVEVCRLIGSYAAVGAIFDPPVSAQAVSKWANSGIPPERVIPVARATRFAVTPHRLRPDLYPNPTDGLPRDVVMSEAFLRSLSTPGPNCDTGARDG